MLTQKDSELINQFYNALADKCEQLNIPLRSAGHKQETDNNGNPYVISYYFQIMMSRFELYINCNAIEGQRYGWKMV